MSYCYVLHNNLDMHDFLQNDLEQALNDGVRNIIVNGDELTAKLQVRMYFYLQFEIRINYPTYEDPNL